MVQDGWSAVTPSDFIVEVTQPFTCTHARFKNRTDFACLDVYKKDAYDEAGLPGWTITLQPAYGGVPKSDLTDGTGWVRFNELAPGTYVVSETPQPAWKAVTPESTTITLEASGTCSVVTFYNLQHNQYIPEAPPSWSPPPAGTADCRAHYTVRPGDTLYRIAVKYGVNWQNVQAANHLANPRLIYPNMVLCIP